MHQIDTTPARGTLAARGGTPAAFDGRRIPSELRRSSVAHGRHAPSSRLVSRAPRPSRCGAGLHHGLLATAAAALATLIATSTGCASGSPLPATDRTHAADADGQPAGLFIDAAGDDATAAPAGEPPWGSFTLRQRLVAIDFALLPENENVARSAAAEAGDPAAVIHLNLFDDAAVTATIEHVEPTFSGGYSISGALSGVEGEDGSATLVVNGEHVAGTVRTPWGHYRIRPGPHGLHTVSEIDPSRLPPGGEPLQPPDSAAAPTGRTPR